MDSFGLTGSKRVRRLGLAAVTCCVGSWTCLGDAGADICESGVGEVCGILGKSSDRFAMVPVRWEEV